MNCAEFERLLPDMLESVPNAEQQAHLRTCAGCSDLVSDFNVISRQARLLSESEEPSPRVWNTIEATLRQEGLIHPPAPAESSPFRRWSPLWALPVAAALLFAFGVTRYHQLPTASRSSATPPAVSGPVTTASIAGRSVLNLPKEDVQLLEVVTRRAPAMRGVYAADLQNIDAYIRDAEASAAAHPDDEEAQQYLMNAYDQKNMVYEMAMDRSLP